MSDTDAEARRYLSNSHFESQRAQEVFVSLYADNLIAAAEAIGECFRAGGKVLIFGNGGSAADAQHMAAEFVGRLMTEREPLPAIALTTDSSNLTAIGNDYGYEQVFSRQVAGLAKPGDVVVAISTSGNSPNVVHAACDAQRLGCKVISLTGGSGGKLAYASDINLNVSEGKNSCRIQETHIFIIHSLVDLVDRFFLEETT